MANIKKSMARELRKHLEDSNQKTQTDQVFNSVDKYDRLYRTDVKSNYRKQYNPIILQKSK